MTALPERCHVCLGSSVRPYASAFAGVSIYRCASCRSAFVWPRPTAAALALRYDHEHQRGKWQDILATQSAQEMLRRADWVTRHAPPGSGRLLDVGCGNGDFLWAASDAGWTGTGLELSRPIAVLAAERISSRGGRVAVATLDALAPGARFEAVTFWDVLEHIESPLESLQAAFQLLRPGGVIGATMPNFHGSTRWAHGGRWKYLEPEAYGHLWHLSPRGLETFFRRAGFEVVLSTTLGSTDLRHVPDIRGWFTAGKIAGHILDRLSGLWARWVLPRKFGNTLVVIGRKPAGSPV